MASKSDNTEEISDKHVEENTDEINENQPDWALAKEGLKLLINNNAKDAVTLFSRYPDNLVMFAGYSYVVFMEALITFEDEKLNLATSVLREVERKCTSDTGWLRSVKKVFGSQDNRSSLEQSLETQIILADSQVCLAILIFLQQDISGYFKGSWVLRKAWKVYQSTYHQILQLYKEKVGESVVPDEVLEAACSSINSQETISGISEMDTDFEATTEKINNPSPTNGALSRHAKNSQNWSSKLSPFAGTLPFSNITFPFQIFTPTSETLKGSNIDVETVKRLMGAISFGYGLFQLGISLLPPSLIKVTNFLGVGGNRDNGIACLMYARKGVDMRAPLATLAMLWFHTIVRPYYALDGNNVQASVDIATQLLDESDEEFGQSSLFLFFRGRVNRLNSKIPAALKSFQLAVQHANQREIQLLALHEVGWCHLIQLDYCAADETFTYLKSCSKWSRAFYNYLSGISSGACNSSNNNNLKEIRTVGTKTRRTQIDDFLLRRINCFPSDDDELLKLPPHYWRLLIYEMLYLWNPLPSCDMENIEKIRKDCVSMGSNRHVEPMIGLSKLILGCCYCIQNKYTPAIETFQLCIDERKSLAPNAQDAHVSAFSEYEMGCVMSRKSETRDEGKVFLEHVSTYKEYDFEQRLVVRVHSLLKQF